MKYAKLFFLSFLLAAVAGYLSHAGLGASFPNLVQSGIEKYAHSKIAAKSFPISIYLLLAASALTELLISFKIPPKLMELARDNALRSVLKVGGALIGVIAGMTIAFYQAGSSEDVKEGLVLILMVATFVIGPIFIIMVARLFPKGDPNPDRAKVLQWIFRAYCSAIVLISIYGIVDEVTKNAGAAKEHAPATANMSH